MWPRVATPSSTFIRCKTKGGATQCRNATYRMRHERTLRYDTIRYDIFTSICARKLTANQLNLSHGTKYRKNKDKK